MQLIHTTFIENQVEVPLKDCRVYQTHCNDDYFTSIIEVNKQMLGGQFIPTNYLYVIMENEHIQDVKNYYGSISYEIHEENNITLLLPRVITIDNISNRNEILTKLLFQSFEHLWFYFENVKLQLSKDTYKFYSEESILCATRKIIDIIS